MGSLKVMSSWSPACVHVFPSRHPLRSVTDVIVLRCWFLQPERMFLPGVEMHGNSDVTEPLLLPLTSPVSNGHPRALGAALVTGGKLSPRSNYLDDHILFTSASNAQNRRVPRAVFAWKYLRIAAPQSAGGSFGNQTSLVRAKFCHFQHPLFHSTLRSVS